jgi:hypothetical protein
MLVVVKGELGIELMGYLTALSSSRNAVTMFC